MLFQLDRNSNVEQALSPQRLAVRPFRSVFAGRIHNRSELAARLNLVEALSDADLAEAAYAEGGEAAPAGIYGDWCLACWHQTERRLFLARDHFGDTALFYYADADVFAFSTSRKLLLSLDLASARLDELYLAQVLVSWPAYHGEATVHSTIHYLPPAHQITVTPHRVQAREYWHPVSVPTLRLPRRQNYVEALLEVYDGAVRERLDQGGKTAAMLSSGLDSGSTVLLAAAAMREESKRLAAYISVPAHDSRPWCGPTQFGDEQPLAEETARAAGNVSLRPIDAAGLSPIAGIRQALEIAPTPQHAASNWFWMIALFRAAANDGNAVILTGAMGNATISWPALIGSRPLSAQIAKLGAGAWLRRRARTMMPRALRKARIRAVGRRTGWGRTAILPAFADQLQLLERRLNDPWEAPNRAPEMDRQYLLMPGRNAAGASIAELAAATGIAITTPSADPRVIDFCFSVPDHIYFDPETGLDRWLIRETMKGRLPESVRLNRRHGLQAADLVPRLRATVDEVEAALDEIARGPAAQYLDVAHMRHVWNRVRTEEGWDVNLLAITVLTRGIMAGLFVNGFGKRW